MANYYGYARSNYFRVKDLQRFRAAMSNCAVEIVEEDNGDKNRSRRVALLSDSESGWSSSYVDAKGNDVDTNIHDIVAEHLADDEVAIFMEIGYEKLRYLSGYAVAVNNKNKSVSFQLSDIYTDKRVRKLGSNITRAEY